MKRSPAISVFAPGLRRKVSGLRREEPALLAGVSTNYHQRMEQGRVVRPSEEVLDALARALELVGGLSVHSEDFRRLWARHDVREQAHGTKRFIHPMVGEFNLGWDAYPLPGSPARHGGS